MERLNRISSLNDEIFRIQLELKNMDYYTNKWVEGKLTKDEWDSVVARRDELRAEINAKELEISVLKAGGNY